MLVLEFATPIGLTLNCGAVLVGLATTSRGVDGPVVPIPTLPDAGNVLVCPDTGTGRCKAAIATKTMGSRRPQLAGDRRQWDATHRLSITLSHPFDFR